MRSGKLLILFLLPVFAMAAVSNLDIDRDYVVTKARELASRPYDPDRGGVSESFRKLSYDDYRRIRFRPEHSLWRGDERKFQVQFFHPGYLYDRSVELHEFSDDYVQDIPFVRDYFDYQDLHFAFWSKWGLGYAGFKLLNEINQPGKWDEVVSFLGASYFRALGKGQYYGISARGLALNAGGPGEEEFPRFIEFWLGKPDEETEVVTLHALLDGPSVAGAYTFKIQPGDDTTVEVHATLFFRSMVPTVGIAPMTSMFWFGEGSANRYGDFRPEVHDSDGLLVALDDNKRIWRPLINSAQEKLTDISAASVKGFGLLQRDRDFHHYEDIEAHYQQRPSLWAEPIGVWPEGRVRLMELPAASEHHDNIVAFWTPKKPPEPGDKPMELAWRLHWSKASVFGGPRGYVAATRQTVEDGAPGQTLFVIDYAPGSIGKIPSNQKLEIKTEVPPRVKIINQQVIRNEIDGSWRLSIRLAAIPGSDPVEIRSALWLGDKVVTETWSMPWAP